MGERAKKLGVCGFRICWFAWCARVVKCRTSNIAAHLAYINLSHTMSRRVSVERSEPKVHTASQYTGINDAQTSQYNG